MNKIEINYRINPAVTNDELNSLFANAWDKHTTWDFLSVLEKSLLFVCAYQGVRLIGYVNVAWDGGQHAFILDTTIAKDFRRQGIGTKLVRYATAATKEYGIDWIHVDFEPHLQSFYEGCGFRHTTAGLINLKTTNITNDY